MRTSGFSLIETLVYIALLSVLLIGSILAIWNIAVHPQPQSDSELQIDFVLRKVEWVAQGSVGAPNAAAPLSDTLVASRDGHMISISQSGQQIVLSEDGVSYPLSDDRSNAAIQFQYISCGIFASTTIDGDTVSITADTPC